jgi:hypothetical protein
VVFNFATQTNVAIPEKKAPGYTGIALDGFTEKVKALADE